MDPLDIKILRELGRGHALGPFPSSINPLRSIASSLGVDKETVRSRLASLRQRGIMNGWHAMVNPNLLSMKVSRVWVEFPSEAAKEDGIRRLASLPNVRVVYNYTDDSASFVIVLSRSEASEGPVADSEYLSSVSLGRSFMATMKFPPCNVFLSESDWKIYGSLRDDPQKPQSAVSRETGLSSRTVKRRLSAMIDGNALLLSPNLDAAKVDGVAADITVRYEDSDGKHVERMLRSEADDCLIHVEYLEGS